MNLSTEGLAILAGAILPIALIVLFLVFRWRYLRVVRRTIYATAYVAPAGREGPGLARTNSDPLTLEWSDAASVGREAHLLEARTMAHEADASRTILSVSGAVFVLITAVVVWHGQRMHFDVRVAAALVYFSTLAGMVTVLAFIRPKWPSVAAIVCAWIVVGLVLLVGMLAVRWSQIVSLMWSGVVFGSMPLAAVALLTLRRLRPLLVAFVPLVGLWLLISGISIGVLEILGVAFKGTASKSAVAIGLLNLVLGVGVAAWLFRHGVKRWSVAILLVISATGVYGASRQVPDIWMVPTGVGVNAVAALAVGWLFLRFLRLKASGLFPDETLHFSFCWLVLTAYVPVLANSPLWPPWFILPFVAYISVLSLLLRRGSRRASPAPARQLLLLRVFEQGRRSWRLLAMLDEGWRRIGRVDLVVGVDLAERTLSPAALENFVLGRVHRQFVRNETESVQRVATLPSGRALDRRYPLNELHCLPHIWPHVVKQLARACDVVLMDLRGLRRVNTGALFELALIIDCVPLSRIVLLVDGRTDEAALSETAQTAWARLTEDSPNAGRPTPRLSLLRCCGSSAEEAAITQALLLAASRTDPCFVVAE